MTETFRMPADTETDAEAAIIADLMKALAANPIAIAEGAFGAPRIWGKAIQRFADYPVITGLTAVETVQCDQLLDPTSGAKSYQENSGTYTEGWSGTVYKGSGSIRVKYTAASGSGGTGSNRVKKNGTVVSTDAGTTDIAVVPGDVISVESRKTSGGAGTSFGYTNLAIWSSDTYQVRSAWLKYTERNDT